MSNKTTLLTIIIIIIAGTILYLFTLDNGLRPDELTGGDLITHQYAQVEGRPSNAPGYPLYTMLGWLWFRLGSVLFGWMLNPIQILSAYSAWWSVASLVVLYLILDIVLQKKWPIARWPIALLLTAFYATTFFFWYYSVTTEQYSSAVFQTLLLIWLAFKWDINPRDSLLLGLAFISGTMLANMVTTLFILPPLLWFIFFKKTESGLMLVNYLKRPKLVIAAIAVTAWPLLSYAYIYIRGAQHPEWRGEGQWASTWAWFSQFITIQQGRDELGPGLSLQNFFTAEYPALMWQELTWLIFLGGLIGLTFLGRRRAIFLYSTLVIYAFFTWAYRFGNWFQVIIPAYPIFIIGFAAAIQRLDSWRWVIGDGEIGDSTLISPSPHLPISSLRKWINKLFMPLLYLILGGLVIYRFNTSLPAANQYNRSEATGLNPGWAILADNPLSPAHIYPDFEERIALQYLQTVWGVDSQLTPLDPDQTPPSNGILYLSRRAAAAQPELLHAEGIHPQAAGEQLIALNSMAIHQLPANATPIAFTFGDSLSLLGWERIAPGESIPNDVLQSNWPQSNWAIALYWQTSLPLDSDYTISVRPLVGGQLIMNGPEAAIQDHQPVWGTYPTTRWPAGEVVRDVYALTIPDGITPNAVQIVIYKSTTDGFENLGDHMITIN